MAEELLNNILIIDAVALIDFRDSDPTILALISSKLGQLVVASPVLDEVNNFDESDCLKYGIKVIEPSFEQLEKAVAKRNENKSLSLMDLICLVLAKENDWVCITNDKRLRRECQNEGVEIYWDLEMLIKLVEKKELLKKEAKEIAYNMHKNNFQLTKVILERFNKKIDAS